MPNETLVPIVEAMEFTIYFYLINVPALLYAVYKLRLDLLRFWPCTLASTACVLFAGLKPSEVAPGFEYVLMSVVVIVEYRYLKNKFALKRLKHH